MEKAIVELKIMFRLFVNTIKSRMYT